MIRLDEIEKAAGWMLGDPSLGDGARLDEWGTARSVDLASLFEFARNETAAALDEARHLGIGEGGLQKAVAALAVQCFIAGVEAERQRRDGEGLPA